MISYQVCPFGCHIVCALLFQRFLENDHHVSAHARLIELRLLQGGTVGPSRLVQCDGSLLRECASNPAWTQNMRSGGHVRQRNIQVASETEYGQTPQFLSSFDLAVNLLFQLLSCTC